MPNSQSPSSTPALPALRRFLIGATATGKTAVAFALAAKLKAAGRGVSLISMDSMLVYRDLDIVTAKPNARELEQCPVAAIDLANSSEPFSVARYVEYAQEAELDALARGAIPIFSGGTGLYLKTLTHGLFAGPPAQLQLRELLEKRAAESGVESLHSELLKLDPESGSKIHPNDLRRIVRALEVLHSTGKPISQFQRQWSETGSRRAMAALRVEKDELLERIRARIDWMFEHGAVEEVRRARERGLSREASEAVGVREILNLLDGTLTNEAARAQMLKRTKELARRQMTWFRSYPEIRWIEAGAARSVEAIVDEVSNVLEVEC
ncbi:MAG: tRNA (adenosine(37)-N6)-dimethylallyltransferase MiaA [Planctomycetes bacterium]|nr:tRNA (adenosine(37)-N6)-dimethylallyltransferase MiaA [Planctomycetota bacterium]